jgi:hypothetical protein
MLVVDIWNSWIINQIRSMAYPGETKHYYSDRIISEVFKKATLENLLHPLRINFVDNHHSNIDYLNYKELHSELKKYFSSVQFYSDNIIDHYIDPEYFEFLMDNGYINDEKKFIQSMPETISWDENKKMFGLYLSRPDVHRFCILVEFYKRGLLNYTDCRLGFDKNDLMADEHWRESCIDLACKIMNVSHEYIFEIVSSIGKNGRDYKNRGNEVSGEVKETFHIDYTEKSWLNNNFVLEIVCMSTTTNNIFVLSEKLEKLLVLGQPFIVIGSPHMYGNMHKCDIKTFGEFWDESWDDIPHERLGEKISRIADSCEYIIKTYTPKDLYDKTKFICEHNKKVHLSNVKNYNSNIDYDRITNINYLTVGNE